MVPFGFEPWIEWEDTFDWEGEKWGIFKKKKWLELESLKEKVQVGWKYTPTAVRAEEG